MRLPSRWLGVLRLRRRPLSLRSYLKRNHVNRELRKQAEDLKLFWEPQGLWTQPMAAQIAQQGGLQLVWPGFEGSRWSPCAPPGWLRVETFGKRRRLAAHQLAEVEDHLEIDGAVQPLVFVGSAGLRDARELLDIGG